jgi:CheY-like chemotaxis protein
VEFEVCLIERPLWVDADSARIAQAVGNLLQNAAKFTGKGGRVTLSLDEEADARQAMIRVRDTGVGIAPEVIGRLFRPFTQVDDSLDRTKGGLGLGLALVKGLAELHGGTVEAHSDGLGKGAAFTLRLPLHPEATVRASAPCPTSTGHARRVLIIEDNLDAANSLCEALQSVGHQLEVAYSGPEGLAKARVFRPQVVLCDIGLPGIDGYQVARTLRADAAFAGVRLVALSGYALPEDLRRAAEAGFDAHLAKPASIEELQGLLAGDSLSDAARPTAPGARVRLDRSEESGGDA